MNNREEFKKQTKRDGIARSNGFCEAVGMLYGLPENTRCNIKIAHGFEFDHVLACSNGGDNSLENMLCVCVKCHKSKTSKFDTPRAAKVKRVKDKHAGIVSAKKSFPKPMKQQPVISSGGLSKGEAAHRAAMAAKGKQIVPRRIIISCE